MQAMSDDTDRQPAVVRTERGLTIAAERRYWEERNRERFAQIAAMPLGTGHPEARAKLAEAKAKLGLS
jgi:hypothetical protein